MKQFAPRYAALGIIVVAGFGVALYLAAQPRLRAQQTDICQRNLKHIGLAMMQYIRDYDEHYPNSARWADDLKIYANNRFILKGNKLETLFECPTTHSFYVYNAKLSGLSIVKTDYATTPWVYEAGAQQNRRNFSDAGESWPQTPVHQRNSIWGNNVLLGNGSVELRSSKPTFRSFATPTPKPPKIKPAKTAKP